MIWLALLLIPAAWLWMNSVYRYVYGSPLRWRYFWAAHGALLFGKRLQAWEAASPQSAPSAPVVPESMRASEDRDA